MKERKTPLSFIILYWMMNIITGLFLVVLLLAIIANILFYTDFFGDNLQLHVSMPVKVNFLEKGILPIAGRVIDIELVEASSKIHFFNTPMFLARKFGLMLLGVLSLALFMTWTFRDFIANVKKGKIFDIDNIFLLQRISYALLGFWLFTIVYMRYAYHYFASRIRIDNVEIVEDFNYYPAILLASLFIWVLSHIFIKGLKLQEEQDLTV